MKRTLFVFLSFLIFLNTIATAALVTDSALVNPELIITSHQSTIKLLQLDTSLNRLQIYDPSARINSFGLGFPGASTRYLIRDNQNIIAVDPIFNSFSSLLYTSDFKTKFDFKKPLTQIEYVIFPSIKTEQYLDLFHVRNINKFLNLGVKIRKIKSNGYYLHQGSNISNALAFVDYSSKNARYHIYSTLVYNSLVSIENGGLKNDSINYTSKGLSLQSLGINLDDAKNRVVLFGGNIYQSFDFGINEEQVIDSLTTLHKFIPSSSLGLSFCFNKHSTTYLDGNPISGFYENVFKDSIDTFDKLSYTNFDSELSYFTRECRKNGTKRVLLSKLAIARESSNLERKDAIKQFENTSVYFSINSFPNRLIRFALNAKYYPSGFNSGNSDIALLIGHKFLDSTQYVFNTDLIGSLGTCTPSYVYQNYYSNHFLWNNNFARGKNQTFTFRLQSEKLFNFNLSYKKEQHYVYLDSISRPEQLNQSLDFFSARFNKLFRLGSFYLNADFAYQKVVSKKDVLGLPKLFSRNSVYWAKTIFKKALDLQVGFDILYTSEYYGLSYQPALNAFYYQNKKQVGGYPAVDFFLNFKIRQVRLFFKVDHLNYGMTAGKYEYTPGYLLPGRTFRFGLSWLFVN